MSIASTASAQRNLLEFLHDRASYPEHPVAVDLVETHISWVFLTDHFAYKLKKPVKLEFLDFSQPLARKRACSQEIELNRRLAPTVYLAVVPVTFEPCRGFEIDGCGLEVDYLVRMRRLSAEHSLKRLIHQRKVRGAHYRTLSKCLVDFYTRLPPKVLQPQDHHQHLVNHCDANLSALLGYRDPSFEIVVRRVHNAQKRYLTLQKSLFFDRVRDGRIVDGHGDLRAEHVYLESPPAIIDCVEFSEELREVDVVDDLSFLAMDCQRLGDGDIGNRLLEDYELASSDEVPRALVAFYKCYRACVRGKVAALRAEQTNEIEKKQAVRQVHQYLVWADHYAAHLGPPALVITGGLMGSGKSTLASKLASALGAELLSTDQLRRSQFGSSQSLAKFGTQLYRSELRQCVYDELLARAGNLLDEGRSVILDGSFLTNALRLTALDLGKRHGALSLFVECVCPQEISLERIFTRMKTGSTESEARPELYSEQLKEREALHPSIPAIRVDSDASFHEELQAVFAALRSRLFESSMVADRVS